MTWRLRPAVQGDADALALVAAATFLQTYAGVLNGADIVAHCRDRLSPAAFAALVADPAARVMLAEHEEGRAPVGYSVALPSDLPIAGAGDAELLRLYALASVHGTGLGSAMMEDVVRDARAAGRPRLLVGTYHGNHQARRFYERRGFALVGERSFRLGGTVHVDPVYALAL